MMIVTIVLFLVFIGGQCFTIVHNSAACRRRSLSRQCSESTKRTRTSSSLLFARGRSRKDLKDLLSIEDDGSAGDGGNTKTRVEREDAGAASSRRERSREKKLKNAAARSVEAKKLSRILELVGEKERDLGAIRAAVDDLKEAGASDGSIKTLVKAKTLVDYDLAFATDNDSVSFIGSGLHKVPLARMDFFFLTLGQGNLLIREVIRCVRLGPFQPAFFGSRWPFFFTNNIPLLRRTTRAPWQDPGPLPYGVEHSHR